MMNGTSATLACSATREWRQCSKHRSGMFGRLWRCRALKPKKWWFRCRISVVPLLNHSCWQARLACVVHVCLVLVLFPILMCSGSGCDVERGCWYGPYHLFVRCLVVLRPPGTYSHSVLSGAVDVNYLKRLHLYFFGMPPSLQMP